MTSLDANSAAVVIVVAILWVGLASAIAVLAARRFHRAQAVIGVARSLKGLIDGDGMKREGQRREGAMFPGSKIFWWSE